jgi:hypothetical protein
MWSRNYRKNNNYYQNNKEKIICCAKNWQKNNREKTNEDHRTYRLDNKLKIAEWMRNHY